MKNIISNNFSNALISIGEGKANGTFGELLQGVLPNQKKFMVTFPISLFSYAKFVPKINATDVLSFPQHKIKSVSIAKKIIKYFNLDIGGDLFINSEMPEGKGLASSSADLVATAYAVTNSINANIDEKLIAKFIAEIEPSDGVMYLGVVSFYYQEVELIEYINNLLNIVVIAVDEGYTIDTLLYNNREKFYTPACAIKYQDMLIKMTAAIKARDVATVGKISTESAIMNQKNNPKYLLKDFISISNDINALGIAVAHSGSYIGIMLDPNSAHFCFQKAHCLEKLKKLNKRVSIFNSFDINAADNATELFPLTEEVYEC